MARITVATASFVDALDQDDPLSLDQQYPEGDLVNEHYLADESLDPLYILMARQAEETYHAS